MIFNWQWKMWYPQIILIQISFTPSFLPLRHSLQVQSISRRRHFHLAQQQEWHLYAKKRIQLPLLMLVLGVASTMKLSSIVCEIVLILEVFGSGVVLFIMISSLLPLLMSGLRTTRWVIFPSLLQQPFGGHAVIKTWCVLEMKIGLPIIFLTTFKV